MDERRFTCSEVLTGQTLAAFVAETGVLRQETPVETEIAFYDSFDWRLFARSAALYCSGNEWVLRRLPTGELLETLPVAAAADSGELAGASAAIRSIVAERRLLPVGRAWLRTTPYRVLNDDEKTIARLLEDEVQPDAGTDGNAPVATYVTLLPVRGYVGHFRRLAAQLEAAGLISSRWDELYGRIVAAAGKRPGDYSARPDYQLRPDMRSDEAARIIHRQTLAVIRANEPGIIADWDIEFLHDYRTAVRRTRSALSQIAHVFDPDSTEAYKQAFGMLGERTNRLRDIDVYLASEAAYRAMLPGAMTEHISPVFDFLRAQRRQALTEVSDYLSSSHYVEWMAEWDAFLNRPASGAPNAARPIGELARRQIRKRYRQVIEDGSQIHAHTEDEIVHALRIDCKKLRYLIEFFASLFPKKEIERLVDQMKALQDQLGLFNDLSVQQIYLMQLAETLPAADAQGKRGLVAIGFLVEKLALEQQEMKPGIVKRFAEFAAPANRALFRQLFKQGDRMTAP